MDANDLIMKNIEMLEKMQKQELQILKQDFDSKMKDLTLKFEKLDETLSNLKDMLDSIQVQPQEPEKTTDELIEHFKKRKEEEEKLKQQAQPTLNTSMPSLETIKNNL